MKSIRPVTLLAAGPLLLGIAFTAGTWLALPSFRHVWDMLWAFLIGFVGGLVFFGPVAAVLAVKARHPAWLLQHGFRISWYTSMAMGLSLGYLAACIRHGLFDNWALAGFGVVAMGAAIKIGLSDALQPRTDNAG